MRAGGVAPADMAGAPDATGVGGTFQVAQGTGVFTFCFHFTFLCVGIVDVVSI